MSLGSQYSNKEKGKKQTSVNVYSGFTFANADSEIDPTKLFPEFALGMLKLSILPRKIDSKADYPEYDRDAALSIWLSVYKAQLLLDDIRAFIADPTIGTSVGVDSGSGIICISDGKEFGYDNYCIVIRKINPDTGLPEISYAYQCKQHYHYTIRNYNSNTADFDKIYHDNLELEMFCTLLEQYIAAMTNAQAYALMEQMKYNNSRTQTKLDGIMEHLGISYVGGGNGSSNKNTSIFQKREGNNFNKSSIDDIDKQL